jgi:ribosome-binding protein aMBF1 (putative translation factor)
MMPDESFAIRLMRAQATAGLNQNQLAKACETPHEVISRYQQGKTKPNYDMLIRLARALDVSTDYLCGLKEQS